MGKRTPFAQRKGSSTRELFAPVGLVLEAFRALCEEVRKRASLVAQLHFQVEHDLLRVRLGLPCSCLLSRLDPSLQRLDL